MNATEDEKCTSDLKIHCPCGGMFSLSNILQHNKSIRHKRYIGVLAKKLALSNREKTEIWYAGLPAELKSTYMLIESDKIK